MFTKKFWRDAGERAAKTAIQAGILAGGYDMANASGGFDATAADWSTIGSFALGGAILSIAFSVVSSGVGPSGSPSVVQEAQNEPLDDPEDAA